MIAENWQTYFMRLRNSSGSESSESSTTLTNCSRFILHPPTNEGTLTSSIRYFRRHPFFRVTFVFLFLFLFLFVFWLVWFFSKADIGNGGAIRKWLPCYRAISSERGLDIAWRMKLLSCCVRVCLLVVHTFSCITIRPVVVP
jgi:hypothetical protein